MVSRAMPDRGGVLGWLCGLSLPVAASGARYRRVPVVAVRAGKRLRRAYRGFRRIRTFGRRQQSREVLP